MIPSNTIDDIRNRSDILQVIGEYVPLKKRGKNYIGLCPFHSEKTPSFTVSADKQIFHCFGCGEGGNVFTFIMKSENISFAESVAMLGEKIGIKVSISDKAGAPSDKEKYFSIMSLAQKHFVECLNSEEGSPAKDYIAQRGLTEGTVNTFGLGYSLNKWDSLMNHLFKKGVSYKDMEKLGLIIERDDKSGYYDRFRGRFMFPISNIRGQIVGFSGRIIGQGEEAKYVNSPDSPIYNKGYSLYGINVTKDAIKKAGSAVLVEGNVDLLSCWQYGIKNVIAPLGTAFTSNQAKMIKRFAEKVIIAFDSDNAGALAAARTVDILKEEGVNVYVAKITGGKDPDEALRKEGAESFIGSLNNAMPWIEFNIMNAISKFNIKEIEQKAKAVKEAAKVIANEKDEFVQKGYIKMIAEKLGFTYDEIASEVKRQGSYKKETVQTLKKSIEKPALKLEKAEESLIKLSIENKDILNAFKEQIKWDQFTGSVTRTIAEVMQSLELGTSTDLPHTILENLPDEESRKLFSKIMVTEHPAGDTHKVASDCIKTIKAHHLKDKMENIRGKIQAAEKEGRHDNISVLHREFNDINEAYRSLSI